LFGDVRWQVLSEIVKPRDIRTDYRFVLKELSMAIEPKSPRKRAIKKSSKKSLAPSADSGEKATQEVTAVPITVEATEAAPKSRKKAAVPVPIFQAPEVDKSAPKARKATAKSAPVKDDVSTSSKDSSNESDSSANVSDSDSDSESRSARNRRRRRGGRGRRKPNGQDGATSQDDSEENDSEGSEDETNY
jgi:ribonuclease E